jgi:hypothetical protein
MGIDFVRYWQRRQAVGVALKERDWHMLPEAKDSASSLLLACMCAFNTER